MFVRSVRRLTGSRSEGLAQEPWLAGLCGEAGPAEEGGAPEILYPNEGADFVLFSDLQLGAPYTGRIAARKGEHTLSVHRRADGAELAHVSFRVRAEPALPWEKGSATDPAGWPASSTPPSP